MKVSITFVVTMLTTIDARIDPVTFAVPARRWTANSALWATAGTPTSAAIVPTRSGRSVAQYSVKAP